MSLTNSVADIIPIIRGLIDDKNRIDGRDSFRFNGSDNIFTLTEDFVSESTIAVFQNGTQIASQDFTYNSDNNTVTIEFITSGESLNTDDNILITYDYFKKYSDIEYRRTHYMDYINAAFELNPEASFVGFKLLYIQNIKARDKLIEDPSYRKILLYRENELACFSSRLIAEETGQGNAKKGDIVLTDTVPFNQKEFEAFCKRRSDFYQKTRQLLAQIKRRRYFKSIKYIDIDYKDAVTTKGMRRTIDFIGADINFKTEPNTLKRNTNNIVERFNSPDKVMDYLKSIGKEEWAVEDIK